MHSFIAIFPVNIITQYSGINTVAKYMNRQNLMRSISSSFPTVWHNTTKFGGNQEDAEKGLLVFVSEMKMLYHSWFRADSRFFLGKLFDLLEFFSWDYLVNVKLQNLEDLLKVQKWTDVAKKLTVSF